MKALVCYCDRCHRSDAWLRRHFERTQAALRESGETWLPMYVSVCEPCGDVLEAELWREVKS